MTYDAILSFLTAQLHTQDVGHSGRTLFTHLCGTYNLLKQWGNRPEICYAGLYHSIYGTWHFRHRSLSLDQRPVVAGLIGARAELLVHAFCVTQRPRAFLAAHAALQGEAVLLTDHTTGHEFALSAEDLTALLEIEAANLLEQGGRIAGVLTEIMAARISPGARQAITEYLATAKVPA